MLFPPKEKIFNYSHDFRQAQYLLCLGGASAENNQIRDLGPSGSRCSPQMVAHFCSPYPESLIANLGSAVPQNKTKTHSFIFCQLEPELWNIQSLNNKRLIQPFILHQIILIFPWDESFPCITIKRTQASLVGQNILGVNMVRDCGVTDLTSGSCQNSCWYTWVQVYPVNKQAWGLVQPY